MKFLLYPQVVCCSFRPSLFSVVTEWVFSPFTVLNSARACSLDFFLCGIPFFFGWKGSGCPYLSEGAFAVLFETSKAGLYFRIPGNTRLFFQWMKLLNF